MVFYKGLWSLGHRCYVVLLSTISLDFIREKANPLALVCDVYCDFVTFQFGSLGQV